MTRTARLRGFYLKCSVNWLFTISDSAKIIKMWLDEGVIDHFSHIQEASAISNDTNGPSLFRAPMPEDIFLTTWSGWFFPGWFSFPNLVLIFFPWIYICIWLLPNLVPRVFSLPPPYGKARRPWGRGCLLPCRHNICSIVFHFYGTDRIKGF